jgi:xanthine/uracil permease
MFEFTVVILDLMRKGKLYNWCNLDKSVWTVVNKAYISMFLKFMIDYIEENGDITTINKISDQTFNMVRTTGGFPLNVKEYCKMDD